MNPAIPRAQRPPRTWNLFTQQFRDIIPAWAIAMLLPLPALTFWQIGEGRAFALGYLFLGCAILAADSFGQELKAEQPTSLHSSTQLWYSKMMALGAAMLLAATFFSLVCWSMNDPETIFRYVPLLPLVAIIPAFCTIPYLTLVTRKPFAAVVFSCFLLGLIKIIGCIVVRIVYGPHALAQGYMNMSWTHPNLLVWFCLTGVGVYCICFYILGFRKFQKQFSDA